MARETFTVVYRMGGRENCQWREALPVETREAAQQIAAEIERGGRKALVFATSRLRAVGLPEGWEAGK